MVSFFFPPDPPEPSRPVNYCVEPCPPAKDPIKFYRVEATVTTRAGNIPLEGLTVLLDGANLGKTDNEGKSPRSSLRSKNNALIEVHYQSAAQRLKQEVFTLPLTGISADSKSYTVGKGKNFISKVQDVFGSGAGSMPGDLDFEDEYAYDAGLVSMENTDDPDIKLLKVAVKMATFSLQVPYLSQVGTGETITTRPPSPANPTPGTYTFRGSIICMPTSTTMLIDYWGITASGGGALSRNALMQRCWDEHSSPSTDFPCPWQNWEHLRTVTGELADESSLNTYSVTDGPSGTDGSIPSVYANGILGELVQGRPVVTSTYATSGHVMVVRGAVVDHSNDVQWLIFNDPYGNLASPQSLYDELDISAPVGLRGDSDAPVMNLPDDLLGVREALQSLGHYNGPMSDPVDENDPNDPTILAIKSLQGGARPDGRVDPGGAAERKINRLLARGTKDSYSRREEEANLETGAASDRGRHVYYSSSTEAKGTGGVHRFKLKTEAWTLDIERSPALTTEQIKAKLILGA